MTERSLYSDRELGPRPRELEHIPEATWRGLLALVETKINSDWLAEEFPDMCPDGNGIAGTDRGSLFDTMAALIPDLDWREARSNAPDTPVQLDLIEFVAQRVSEPEKGLYHSFFRHHELYFDKKAGQATFRDEVNLRFSRGGVAFELNNDLRVVRLGPTEARPVLADLRPDSGDPTLDRLINEARARYLSREHADARIGLERLWDAFERLKTIEPGRDKKASVTALLDRVASGPMRSVFEAEARTLTDLGNSMQIRHFETGKTSLTDLQVDYLFTRMATFLCHLLRETNRLAV